MSGLAANLGRLRAPQAKMSGFAANLGCLRAAASSEKGVLTAGSPPREKTIKIKKTTRTPFLFLKFVHISPLSQVLAEELYICSKDADRPLGAHTL